MRTRSCETTFRRLLLAVAAGCALLTNTTSAAPPWLSLVPFKHVEADSDTSYELEEAHGPWMIMCTSFAGEHAEEQARELVLELRRSYKLEAYTFSQSFDFTKSENGLGFNKYGGPKKMKPINGQKFEEIAVLVGHFQSVEDPGMEKALKTLKYARPQCFERTEKDEANQRYAALRQLYRKLNSDPAKKTKGPMGSAFATRNPLLPEEYFVAKGLDPFVVDMNEDLKYSLLKNPGKYTVRVASFRGVDTMKPAEFEEKVNDRKGMSKLDMAAIKATKMTETLRKQGIEAYEFHDRTESIVCIGSFDSPGEPRLDGKIEINPAVYRVMQEFGPIKQSIPGQNAAALQPRMLDGVPFDAQPLPVEVPRESIATAYNRSNLLP